jgi:hypothetical protein
MDAPPPPKTKDEVNEAIWDLLDDVRKHVDTLPFLLEHPLFDPNWRSPSGVLAFKYFLMNVGDSGDELDTVRHLIRMGARLEDISHSDMQHIALSAVNKQAIGFIRFLMANGVRFTMERMVRNLANKYPATTDELVFRGQVSTGLPLFSYVSDSTYACQIWWRMPRKDIQALMKVGGESYEGTEVYEYEKFFAFMMGSNRGGNRVFNNQDIVKNIFHFYIADRSAPEDSSSDEEEEEDDDE